MHPSTMPGSKTIQSGEKGLDFLVTIPQIEVSSGENSDTFSVQVARHNTHRTIFYGVGSAGGAVPSYIYTPLHDNEGKHVTELQPQHLDCILAGIILEVFGTKIEPREASKHNPDLYDKLIAGVKKYFSTK